MKKRISTILITIILSFFTYAQETNIIYYKAMDNNINIRTEPNTNCKKLGQLFNDDVIKVYQDKSTNEWLYCYIPKIDNYGYCYSKYFEKYKPWFNEIVNNIIDEDSFYIEMVNLGNFGKSPSYDIFTEKIEGSSEEKIIKLIRFAYKYNCIYDNWETVLLTECVIRNYLKVTDYLLSETMQIEEINSMYSAYYGPPIFFPIVNGNIEMLELLLKYDANPNEPARNGEKMFYWINQQIEKEKYPETKGNELKEILLRYGYKE